MSSGAQGWLGEHMDCICESKLEVVGIIYIYIYISKKRSFIQSKKKKKGRGQSKQGVY